MLVMYAGPGIDAETKYVFISHHQNTKHFGDEITIHTARHIQSSHNLPNEQQRQDVQPFVTWCHSQYNEFFSHNCLCYFSMGV